MKIKPKQHNQDQIINSKKPFQKGKENNLSKSQSSICTDPQREFATDITKKYVNCKYKFIVPQAQLSLTLPSFLKPKECMNKEISLYQQSIISYVIQKNEEYELSQRTKRSLRSSLVRSQIIEYFSSIALRYKLLKKTLFLATYYLDKYLDIKECLPRGKQLVIAQACMYIAMKYQQIYPPVLKDWCSHIPQLIAVESSILQLLDFKLAYTSAQHYLQLYLSKRPAQTKQQTMLYQCLLELYLATGTIYSDHPLKIVQEVLDSFRSTLFMENQTHYSKIDRKVKSLILQNQSKWNKILQHNQKYSLR